MMIVLTVDVSVRIGVVLLVTLAVTGELTVEFGAPVDERVIVVRLFIVTVVVPSVVMLV